VTVPEIDWQGALVPTMSYLELILRGSVMYLFILAVMRLFRREAGALSIADLLVIVLVADAAQDAMTGTYRSLPEGLVLVGTIFAWNYLLDWLGFRYRWAHRLLHPAPLLLVEDGRINRRNLRAELLTMEELLSHLREDGVEDVSEVRRCYLEPDGHLSVIRREPGRTDRPARKSPA
jgi:uncharacterized membrane protein YcaP (DUF421 family)